MDHKEFEQVFEHRANVCREVLIVKAAEYATEGDRLHNFKAAAALKGTNPAEALGGMLVKHLVSLFDMIGSGEDYSREIWDEKIGDSLNYLFLLDAIVVENENEKYRNAAVQKAPTPN